MIPQSDLSEITEKFSCPICRTTFMSDQSLENHLKAIHLDERKYKCEICQEAFYLESKLNAHSKIHLENHVCEICDQGFATVEEFTRH